MAIAKVQTRSTNAGFVNTGGTATLAFSSNVTAGSLLVVLVGARSSTSVTVSVSDNKSNSWSQAGGYVTDGSGGRFAIFYTPNAAAGATTITLTVTASLSSPLTWAQHEYSGCATTSPLDAVGAGNTGVSTTPITTGTVVVNASGELVVAGYSASVDVTTSSVASPFTQREFLHSASVTLATADDTNASSTEGATFTPGALATYSALAASFKAASTGGPFPHFLRRQMSGGMIPMSGGL